MKGGWFKVYALAYLLFLYAPIILLPLFAFMGERDNWRSIWRDSMEGK